jgi:hypothetical protein
VRARIALATEPADEERLQRASEAGHRARPPWLLRPAPLARAKSSGTPVKYQYVDAGSAWPSWADSAAVANIDFTGIHHNTENAQSQCAPEIYMNNVFAQGMWERVVREFIGLDGVIKKIGPFRMKSFVPVGEMVAVIARTWQEVSGNYVELALRSQKSNGDSVVGTVFVTLPHQSSSR